MPAYFRFLTILAFHVFLQEKVGVFSSVGIQVTAAVKVMLRCAPVLRWTWL